MKKNFIFIVFIFILAGCQSASTQKESNLRVKEADNNANINVALSNPASSFCLKNDAKLEGKTDKNGGQYNICIFKDDTRCEEWSYFYGKCKPGGNIMIAFPKNDQEVTFPFTIIGQARVFENNFNYRIKDSAGKIILSGFASSNARDMGLFGDFEITIDNLTDLPNDKNILLEVLEYSAKDGSEINLVAIPLKLNVEETSTVSLYFNNNDLDPAISCNKVFSVKRIIPKTEAIAKAAIELLLIGPTTQEYKSGYQTSLNSGIKLNSINIENGIAKVDFDQNLQAQVGGSCRVSAIRAQITETLKQFPTVKEVVISINGNSEEILQP